MRFGGPKTALFFRDKAKAQATVEKWDKEDEDPKAMMQGGLGAFRPESTRAQQIIGAVYKRWLLQLQRWSDYRALFGLLAFITLYLGVLYAQRGAHIAYQVHSTISSVVVPASTTMQSQADVYGWLQNLLKTVWQDPTCGDGICEAPFEFASYGRFGCRADCGRLSEVQKLTQLQVDLYYDFSHQQGSLPASDLMNQAAWNLCPVKIQFNSDCYYDSDQTFTQLQGEVHATFPDVPDGQWDLVVKRDMMQKIRGAVRDSTKVAQAAFWVRVYIAATAAAAEQTYEQGLLRSAVNISSIPLLAYLPDYWDANGQDSKDAFDQQQLMNATCACSNGTFSLVGTPGYNAATYIATNCTGGRSDPNNLLERTYDASNNPTIAPASDIPTTCTQALLDLERFRDGVNASVLALVVNQRLGNLKDTGKSGARLAAMNSLRAFLQANYPELVDPVFTVPTGVDPINNPLEAKIDALASLFVESDQFLITGAPAHLALFRRRLTGDPGVDFNEYVRRSNARLAEIAAQQARVATFLLKGPLNTNLTVGAVQSAFQAANATSALVPAIERVAGGINITYNLAKFDGNTTAYLECNLGVRGPDYVGRCEALPVTCATTSNDSVPYTCTKPDNTTVPGNISSSAYREQCELPCDRQLDCAALCECYDTCTGTQVCRCDACDALYADAKIDGEFITIQSAAGSAGSAAAVIANTQTGRRRRLQQTTNDDIKNQLITVLGKLDELRTAQTGITTSMGGLQDQVNQANLLAEQRNTNAQLLQLISAGRADIAAGQRVLEDKLNILLQKQQAALDAVNRATAQLGALQSMAQKQAEALTALDAAVQNKINAISVATQQGVISLAQALAFWKLTRRSRALELKIYALANMPCTNAPLENPFTLDNGNSADTGTARERTIGLNNRVIGGLLVHTWRNKLQMCSKTRFSAIQNTCSGAVDKASYGVDPVFKMGSTLYNPDLFDPNDAFMLGFYNCSQLTRPTYNLVEYPTNLTINPAPYCAELFNPRSLPYAFHHLPLNGLPDGFPIWFDINLSEDGAQTWYNWVQQGLLLDDRTRGLQAQLVTYNPELQVFGDVLLRFEFSDGGTISVSYSIYTLRLELYSGTAADNARFAAEIILAALILLLVILYMRYVVVRALAGNRPGGCGWKKELRRYFMSPAHWTDFISNALLVTCTALWWRFVNGYANNFNMALRYPVYDSTNLQPDAFFLKLADDGAGLTSAWAAIRRLTEAINLLSWYYALNGINILLLIARVLRAMDFQPRLGVVTRSLRVALPDLLHFALVAGCVFIGYSMMAYLIFGNSLSQFSDFGTSINTCFEMLLGNFGNVNTDLRALGGLQSVAGAFFFWTFELLVFMVLLNFLLAIIVDAFSEVKERTKETTGIHVELARMAADAWGSFTARLSGKHVSQATLKRLLAHWSGVGGVDAAAVEAMRQGEEGGEEEEEDDGQDAGPSAAVQRCLQVRGMDVNEDMLKNVLLNLVMDPSRALGSSSSKEGAGANKAVKMPAPATPEEVAAVAKYVIQRFGVKPKPEEEAGQAREEESEEEEDEELQTSHVTAPSSGLGAAGVALEAERDRLATALERLAGVQRELAEAQRNLMAGQKQLSEQQARLVGYLSGTGPDGR